MRCVVVALFLHLGGASAWLWTTADPDDPENRLKVAIEAGDQPAQIKALSDLVVSQSAELRALKEKLAGDTATCADTSGGSQSCAGGGVNDITPAILRPFRQAEALMSHEKRVKQLIPQFRVAVGSQLSAIALSSAILDSNAPKVVVAADATGTLHVYDRHGALGLSQPHPDAEESQATELPAISSVAIGPRDDPFVAAATLGGEVLVYNLTLSNPRRSKPTALKLAARVAPLLDSSGVPIPVLAVEYHRRGARPMVVAGDAAGTVRLYFRNGTLRCTPNSQRTHRTKRLPHE